LGDEDKVRIAGLRSATTYHLSLWLHDENGQSWCSAAKFRTNAAGRFDTSVRPVGGSYMTADLAGLFWSATQCRSAAQQLEPHQDYRTAVFRVSQGNRSLMSAKQKIWLKPPDVSEKPVPELHGARLLQPASGSIGLVIVVGGSEGGIGWARRISALLAHHGFVALAIPYIRLNDLPSDLAEIPLERISDATSWLTSRFPQRPLMALGYSRGAEMVVAAAAINPSISRIVAISPGSVVHQAALPGTPRSSWTVNGKPLPFLRYLPQDAAPAPGDSMSLRLSALGSAPFTGPEHIAVEKIKGPLLLISGDRDRVWPSSLMAEEICARRTLLGNGNCRHLLFADAGHMIFGPGWSPTTHLAKFGGGEARSLAAAQAAGWAATIAFLLDGASR
jgi:dienelactone hydrolase